MRKMLTGPMQFTPYRPWSEERKLAASRRFAIGDADPNAETIAAMSDMGAVIAGDTEEIFDAIIASDEADQSAPESTASQNNAEGEPVVMPAHAGADTAIDDWLPMETAPLDRFALYRLADSSEERRGCIDFVTPRQVWLPELSHYRPLVHFNGWKPLQNAEPALSFSNGER